MLRRDFLANSAAILAAGHFTSTGFGALPPGSRMAYGLVTYQWAKDWDLPTLLANCVKAGVLGVELRTTHQHGVEPALTKDERSEVRRRFADARVELVGIGSNERYDNPDAAVVKQAVEATKKFILLSHDVGGTGVKVKPDRFHDGVPKEKTIEQIGKALHELADFGAGYGQQLRLEVHGQCGELPTIKKIMEVADHWNAAICWNSNPQDLEGDGLEANFQLVRKYFGRTCHVRPLNDPTYPYRKLIKLLVDTDYDGWVMLEDGKVPDNAVERLAAEAKLFKELISSAG